MIFYKLKFRSFPSMKFATCVRTNNYKNIITKRSKIIEISIMQGASICQTIENKDIIKPSFSFSSSFPDMSFRSKAVGDEMIYLSCAAVTGDFLYEKFDTDKIESVSDFIEQNKDEIVLPMHFMLDENYTDIERLFRLLITEYLKETPEGELKALSLWFEIAASISALFKNSLLKEINFNYGEYYSRKVKRYIEEHYQEKISVCDISSSLGITPNYLSRIFKKSTGKTITEFIALTRLYNARKLAYNKTLTFGEIAKKVGICDASYLNRLFNKYYGKETFCIHDYKTIYIHQVGTSYEKCTKCGRVK